MQIIRVCFGEYNTTSFNRVLLRRAKIDADINKIITRKNLMPLEDFTVYCMGENNYRQIKTLGFNAVKAFEEPCMFPLETEFYRNKLELIRYAMQHTNEPCLYLDWDCVPEKKVENIKIEGSIKANLEIYNAKKCYWRQEAQRQIPNGGFLYINNINILEGIIKTWENVIDKVNDEVAIMKYLDELHGGWIGRDKYKELYEPSECNLHRKGVFQKQDTMFVHYI